MQKNSQNMIDTRVLSIIVSVYNEQDIIDKFWQELSIQISKVSLDTEVVFINDGSIDQSKSKLQNIISRTNIKTRLINFSKNFGHEAALIAGIDNAKGDIIVCLDSDLQHPPVLIHDMVKKSNEGNEIVLMERRSREDAGLFKRSTSKSFYKLLNRLSGFSFNENASDFFLISKNVAGILQKNYRENSRYIRGIIQTLGFQKCAIPFDAPSRTEGRSKYSPKKLIKLSAIAIVSFSKAPLNIGLFAGLIFGLFSVGLGIYSIIKFFVDKVTPPGYTTLVVFISFCFALLFIILGIIGVYLGFIFDELKKRPIYIIESIYEN